MRWQIPAQKYSLIESRDQLIEQLLSNRDIAEREQFFSPKLEHFTTVFEIDGVEKAKKRILKAIKNQEQIFVYGDYDVDGICATAIVYEALTKLGGKVLPYIPHREKEGYGLSKIGLDSLKEKEAKLIITVDNGIVALEQAEYAKSLGLDLIITDHHLPLSTKPDALAIVHSTAMCGSAVAWSLIRQMLPEEEATSFLDLVAMATICDLMPLQGVNRALVKHGLEVLNKTQRVGLLALMQEARVEKGSLDSYKVGYILGPRLNAIGRMEHAMDGLRLLCTKNTARARQLAKHLSETNEQKKRLTENAISEARSRVYKDGSINKQKILVLDSENWIPGIIGLVAGRIAEEFKIPTIAIAAGGEVAKGSARSVNGVDIVELIRGCRDLLIDVGGHPKAAGFSLYKDKIEELKVRLAESIIKVEYSSECKLEVDAYVDLSKLDESWIQALSDFEPFGLGNSKPILASQKVKFSGKRLVGQTGDHLKFKADEKEAIAFSFGKASSKFNNGHLIDIAFIPEINRFNGSSILQLKVLDIIPSA